MKRLVLTFASHAYSPQLRVFIKQLEKTNPEIEFKAIRSIQDPIEILRSRPSEVLRALRAGYDQVILCGVDMIFFRPIHFVESGPCHLFPQFVTPPLRDGKHPSIHDYLRTGLYNSDLQVWNNKEVSRSFLQWWADELDEECVCDFSRGLFFDQTYLNLASGLRDASIHYDGSHNVGFYNYIGQPIEHIHSFHFTGFDETDPGRISKHQNRIRAQGDLLELMHWYAAELKAARSYRSNIKGER